MSVSSVARARGRPRDERVTRAIHAVAIRQLMELGFARVSMESVAAEAGVSRATVYRRFKDKADLVTSAISQEIAGASSRATDVDPRAGLERFLVELEDRFNRSCIEVLGGLLADREDPDALALHRARVIAPRRAQARAMLERAQETGELAEDADLDLVLDMLVGAVLSRAVSGQKTRSGWAGRALDMVWRAVAAGDEDRDDR